MKRFFILSSIIVLVLLSNSFAFLHVQQANAQQNIPDKLPGSQVPLTQEDTVGYWQSVSCDSTSLIGVNSGHAFFRRFYTISLTSAVVRYSFYADLACKQPLYSFHIFAWSELGKVRTDIPHTREEMVVFDTTLLTAESPQGQKLLSSCGASSWTIGQEYDVTSQGCQAVGIRPKASCVGDYDLERMEHSELTFGYRTGNMCTPAGRPTKTQTSWVKKVSPQDFQG